MSKQQYSLMAFDPATGEEKPWPSHAAQWRSYNGTSAWLFNPWTGKRRYASDVGSDPFGNLILPIGEHVFATMPEPELVTHADGGIYETLITANPAGAAKDLGVGEIIVYRGKDGKGYWRQPKDFDSSMTPLPNDR